MSKETAVEWLVKELRNQIAEGKLNAITISELKMKAKEMEKQQMIEFAWDCSDMWKHEIDQYYNETYK
jgi:hypothetical protein